MKVGKVIPLMLLALYFKADIFFVIRTGMVSFAIAYEKPDISAVVVDLLDDVVRVLLNRKNSPQVWKDRKRCYLRQPF